MWFTRSSAFALACVVALSSLAGAQDDGAAFFETNIRPLFARQCQACHSTSAAMSGLRIDSRENLVKGGTRGPAVVPGKPSESLLMNAVMQSGSLKMPPSGKLKDGDIALIGRLDRDGRSLGCSCRKPRQQRRRRNTGPSFLRWRRKLPSVQNPSWVTSPIDAFILAALEKKGLKPAPPADKRTLIRRATFDLTGLPPTPGEVNAFLADNTSQCVCQVIDRLLASPHYGERWARHWLDVARYADSNGLDENLVYRNAWRYRDYVIRRVQQRQALRPVREGTARRRPSCPLPATPRNSNAGPPPASSRSARRCWPKTTPSKWRWTLSTSRSTPHRARSWA